MGQIAVHGDDVLTVLVLQGQLYPCDQSGTQAALGFSSVDDNVAVGIVCLVGQ